VSTQKAPPFRLIAIASSLDAARTIIDTVAALDPVAPIGLMIRDRDHDAQSVRSIIGAIGEVPSTIHLIANGVAVATVRRVHLPFAGHAAAGRLVAEGFSVGVSVHSLGELQVLDLEAHDLAYVTASPIFPTSSKPGRRGIGLAALAELCARSPVPVFALGGIAATSVDGCLDAGAYGIAALSGLDDPRSARELIAALALHLPRTIEPDDAAR
jgi:thiamine monophosphate synthase